jgi:hypothetical protein
LLQAEQPVKKTRSLTGSNWSAYRCNPAAGRALEDAKHRAINNPR